MEGGELRNKKTEMKSFWRKRGEAFRCAWAGIVALFRCETHARIHLLACAGVIIVGLICRLERWEWCAVLLCIGAVFMAEGFNTAIERICDRVSSEWHPLIKAAKDIAAGAVLLIVIAVVAVGLIVFLPHFFSFLSK